MPTIEEQLRAAGIRTTGGNKEPECPDCGGNCYPEHGRHPEGCVFNGEVRGFWKVEPKCALTHSDVGRLAGLQLMDRLRAPDMRVASRDDED